MVSKIGLAGWCLLATVLSAWPAAPARAGDFTGCGIGLADSSGLHGVSHVESTEANFNAIQTKIFRTTLPYNASQSQINNVRRLIDFVRSRGVTDVTVTIDGDVRGPGFPVPTAGGYRNLVTVIVNQLDGVVNYWGVFNEPNSGRGWLAGLGTYGAPRLAQYYKEMRDNILGPSRAHKLMGPDFHDVYSGNTPNINALRDYLAIYTREGGGFGRAVGWHPYGDVERGQQPGIQLATDWFIAKVQEYAPGTPIFITEAGAIVSDKNRPRTQARLDAQYGKANFLLFGLGNKPWVARTYYYHMRQGQPDSATTQFDSALVNFGGAARPAAASLYTATHLESDVKPSGLWPRDSVIIPANTAFNFTWQGTPRHPKVIHLYFFNWSTGQWQFFAENRVASGNSLYSPSGFPPGYWWLWFVAEIDNCTGTQGPWSDGAQVGAN